ncbi:MAG: hypothetical protein RJA52_420 [Bacteroidota bacterium]
MSNGKNIAGFSRKSKEEKLDWLVNNYISAEGGQDYRSFWFQNPSVQEKFERFSENNISNYILPLGIVPNLLVNGKFFAVPMVTEESSVVAAAAAAAKFWMTRGGFSTRIEGMTKTGHVHFLWKGASADWLAKKEQLISYLKTSSSDLTENMESRGGGVIEIAIKDFSHVQPGLFQIFGQFDTRDSMGANFINSILERWAKSLVDYFPKDSVEIIMSILSNFTPDCVAIAEVKCPIQDLGRFQGGLSAHDFARKFYTAVQIALSDPFRAVTHNKGIMNGIDAVILATGNDFRAVEAGAHAFAAASGQYKSLSICEIDDDVFHFKLKIPLALGTVGGLTKLHPLAKRNLEMLGNPSASELMQIVAATGLAQNFAAVRALVTTGIQQGHMKMHLSNILEQLGANSDEKKQAIIYFETQPVSHKSVQDYIEKLRNQL